jgi:uncharacterized phage infection (PIP) family protein YhgE
MNPDSIIIDFEKDVNGNITKTIFTTVNQNGDVYSFDVLYKYLALPIAVMMETVQEYEVAKEYVFQNQVQREIQEMVK